MSAVAVIRPRSLGEWLEREVGADVKRDEPLAPWCTVRAGGSADLLLRPRSPDAHRE